MLFGSRWVLYVGGGWCFSGWSATADTYRCAGDLRGLLCGNCTGLWLRLMGDQFGMDSQWDAYVGS